MEKHQTVKKDIVHKIQAEYFGAYKKHEMERLQKLVKCNPEATPEAYYECMDSINNDYDNSRRKLNHTLMAIDTQYDHQLNKCATRECEDSATA